MRRLPIYFLIDVSESMVGEPIRQLEKALTSIVNKLRQDPQALETAYLSIIAFAGKAKTLTPLVDLATFYMPQIPIGSGTSLGAGLEHLVREIESGVKATTAEQRGDWNPLVFLITDGKPTDNPENGIAKWKQYDRNNESLVAITLGHNADLQTLAKLTPNILAIDNLNDSTIQSFVNWISASVGTHSQALGNQATTSGISLAKPDKNLVIVENASEHQPADPDHVIISAKCQKTLKPYLLKYTMPDMTGFERFAMQHFELEGVFALDSSYDEMSASGHCADKVNTRRLNGAAGCPHCGNPFGFAMCKCGGVLCVGVDGKAICPHCDTPIQFDMDSSGSGEFDVGRGLG